MKSLSIAVETAWQIAVWETSAAASQFIEKEHAVIGFLSLSKIAAGKPADMKLERKQWNLIRAEWAALQEVFTDLSLDATKLRRVLRKRLGKGSYLRTENVVHRSPECKAFFQIAGALAVGANEVSSLHLFAAIMGEPGKVLDRLIAEQNIKTSELKKLLIERSTKGFKVPVGEDPKEEKPKSFLRKFGRDLTRLAEEGKLGPFVGRRQELLQVVQTLARNKKSNPVLVGEAGVGKTAIVEALAMRLVENKGPEFLMGNRIIERVLSASLSRRKKMQFFFAGGVPWRVVHGIPVSRWIINWERVWPV